MLAIRLPELLENRLTRLVKQTGHTKSYYVREALEEFLDEQEDYYVALTRLKKKGSRISLEELEQELGLED